MEESFSVGGSGTNGVVKLILETDSSISLWNVYDSQKLEFGIFEYTIFIFFLLLYTYILFYLEKKYYDENSSCISITEIDQLHDFVIFANY